MKALNNYENYENGNQFETGHPLIRLNMGRVLGKYLGAHECIACMCIEINKRRRIWSAHDVVLSILVRMHLVQNGSIIYPT